MRKIIFKAHAYCVGTDHAELVCFEIDKNGQEVSNPFLDEYARDFGLEWANSFMPSIGEDGDDYEDEDQYYEDCGWWWEEYSPTKHTGEIDQDSEGFEEG